MQGDIFDKTNVGNKDNENLDRRRKRVNRIKIWIIVIALILLIIPTISCIFLAVKVNRLQNQMNDLLSLHGRLEYYQNADAGVDNYAYAAVNPSVKDPNSVKEQETDPAAVQNGNTVPDTGVSENPDKQADTGEIPSSPADSSGSNNSSVQDDTRNSSAEQDGKGVISDGKEPSADNGKQNVTAAKDTAQDDAADKENEASPDKNTGDGEIGILNTDSSISDKTVKESSAQDKADSSGIYAGKTVYLTFDDGPSIYTDDILDILKKYNVKATFFVVGETDKNSLKMYKRIIEDGHTLGMHSYSHVYKQIYKSVEDFDKDFTKLWNLLYDTTGYKPTIYRFPGGSANRVNENGMDDFIRYLNKKSIVYFDWNVESGDATDIDYTKEQLIDNVLDGVALKKTSIVLMHDFITEKATRDSLPELLEALISGGARLLPLDEKVTPIQQIKFDSIK